MCIDGNGADLVTLICSQVWVKPVKSCGYSLRNFCPEKVLSQKCLPLWRNVQNWQFFDDPYRSLASNSNKSKKENIKKPTVSASVHSKLWMTMSWNARPLGERDTMLYVLSVFLIYFMCLHGMLFHFVRFAIFVAADTMAACCCINNLILLENPSNCSSYTIFFIFFYTICQTRPINQGYWWREQYQRWRWQWRRNVPLITTHHCSSQLCAEIMPPLVCSVDREMEAAVAVVEVLLNIGNSQMVKISKKKNTHSRCVNAFCLLSPWSFAAQHSLPGSCCAATDRQLPAKVVLSMSQAKTGPGRPQGSWILQSTSKHNCWGLVMISDQLVLATMCILYHFVWKLLVFCSTQPLSLCWE